MLLSPNFKIFNRPLNRTILLLLDRKFVSTSQMKNSLKRLFPWEKLFSLPGISDKCKKTARKTITVLGAMKFFYKNWLPHNFNNGYHRLKEYYNTKEYYFT